MALPISIAKLEDVAEPFREHYEANGNGYRLSGVPDTATLELTLKKERDARKAAEDAAKMFVDVDVEEYRALKQQQADAAKKKAVDAGKVDELLATQQAQLEAKWAKERDAATAELATLRDQVGGYMLTDPIKDVAIKANAHPATLSDIIARSKNVWKLQDGLPVALDAAGIPILKDGHRITREEWVEGLRTEAPNLFQGSTGSGAPAGSGISAPAVGGKWAELTTEQKTEAMKAHGDSYDEARKHYQ